MERTRGRSWWGWLVLVAIMALPASAQAATWATPPPGPWHGWNRFETNGFPVPVSGFPVRLVFLGEPPPGVSVADVEAAAREATARWNEVPCSSARVHYAGRRATTDDLADGEVPFVFAQPSTTQCFATGVIGWTTLACGGPFPDRTVFLNTEDYDWSREPQPFQPAKTDPDATPPHRLVADVQSVLTHELGHVLGLGHSQDNLATMAPAYRADGGQRHLAVDDKLGLCSLYGVPHAPDECTSGRDCPSDYRCALVDGLWMCQEPRGQLGDACALDRIVCTDTCVLPRRGETYGYCTVACGEGEQSCPQGYQCVEGLVSDGQAHCERPFRDDEPGCTASAGSRRTPAPTSWLIGALSALVGLVWRRARLGERASS